MKTKFKVGDRVVDDKGEKGTVTRLGRDKDCIQVRLDSGAQQMLDVGTIKKEIESET